MIDNQPSRRIKPTYDTRFHIDYDWWQHEKRDLRIYMVNHLPLEQREYFIEHAEAEETDWVDPETGEVRRVDALQQALRRAGEDPSFITPQTPLVEAVFRVFLSNGNKPLSAAELSERIGRSANTILRTLVSGSVYRGIRPAVDD
ncbi:MAG: hypothetical protein JXB47_04565 [Anaerolineae bacterium]|nr:hypothetical protein [Anaerolineae bacterium]